MASGFLAGIFWGGVVGTGLLLVSSQTMDRQQLSFPQPETAAVEVPGGSEFDQARVETDPVLPATEDAPGEGIVTGVVPPEDVVDTPPAFDTSALDVPRPSIEGPAGLGEAPAVSDEVEVPPSDEGTRVGSAGNVAGGPETPTLDAPDAPVAAPATDTVAPEAGDAPEGEVARIAEPESRETTPEAGTEIAALPAGPSDDAAPEVPADDAAPASQSEDEAPGSPVAPEISEAPSLPGVRVPEEEPVSDAPVVAEQPEPVEIEEAPEPPGTVADAAPEPGPVPEVSETPDSSGIVTVDGSDSQFFTPVETFGNRAENVETDRLPTVESDSGSEDDGLPVVRRLPGAPVEDAPETPEADVAEAPDVAEGPAIVAHAMDFEAPAEGALISVVLLHEGPEPMSAADLKRLPPEVAYAVEAGAPNAAGVASEYRRAGREVVLIPSLPVGAAPQDVEVALGTNLESIPEAVALMDVSGSSFQSDREAVAQVVAVVTDTGHGLVTFPRGLNTAHQQAGRAGVPTGLIFRILDDDGETPEQIRRSLDRAAFRARQSDAVILVGHTRPDTMKVVAEWSAETGDNITLAPISAALSEE